MHYPDWAPSLLVDYHKWLIQPDQLDHTVNPNDLEIDDAYTADAHYGKVNGHEDFELLETFHGHSGQGLRKDELHVALIGKLVTDLNMKSVWKALVSRVGSGIELTDFVSACEGGIKGWSFDNQYTKAEHRDCYQEIHDTAEKLEVLMGKAREFRNYCINDLVKEQKVGLLLKRVGATSLPTLSNFSQLQTARLFVGSVIPDIYDVFRDIREKAEKYRDEPVTVLKPNSKNANIHYFIRYLSEHCQESYGQPLHAAVATTTSVIFDLPNCDVDYVRKIVN